MKRVAVISLRFVLSGVIILLIWVIVDTVLSPSKYVLPSPSIVFGELYNHFDYYSSQLFKTTLTSATGLALGIAIGAILAFVSSLFPISSPTIETGSVMLRTIPIVALAPIITLWFGTGFGARLVIAAIICFFPIFSSLRLGLDRVERTSILIFETYSATKWQIFRHLRLPTAVSFFIAALPLSATLAVLGSLVAEFCGSDVGLGLVILKSLYRTNISELYVAIILASLLGIVFYLGGRGVEVIFGRYLKNMISVQDDYL